MTQPFGATPHRGTRLSQSVVVAPRSTGIGLPGTHECQQAPMSASWHQGMSAKPVPVLPRTSRMRWFQVATSEEAIASGVGHEEVPRRTDSHQKQCPQAQPDSMASRDTTWETQGSLQDKNWVLVLQGRLQFPWLGPPHSMVSGG